MLQSSTLSVVSGKTGSSWYFRVPKEKNQYITNWFYDTYMVYRYKLISSNIIISNFFFFWLNILQYTILLMRKINYYLIKINL